MADMDVNKVLRCETYTAHVQGHSKTIDHKQVRAGAYKFSSCVIPKAIISRELFDRVQAALSYR
jgi:hypothetical protein